MLKLLCPEHVPMFSLALRKVLVMVCFPHHHDHHYHSSFKSRLTEVGYINHAIPVGSIQNNLIDLIPI